MPMVGLMHLRVELLLRVSVLPEPAAIPKTLPMLQRVIRAAPIKRIRHGAGAI